MDIQTQTHRDICVPSLTVLEDRSASGGPQILESLPDPSSPPSPIVSGESLPDLSFAASSHREPSSDFIVSLSYHPSSFTTLPSDWDGAPHLCWVSRARAAEHVFFCQLLIPLSGIAFLSILFPRCLTRHSVATFYIPALTRRDTWVSSLGLTFSHRLWDM